MHLVHILQMKFDVFKFIVGSSIEITCAPSNQVSMAVKAR